MRASVLPILAGVVAGCASPDAPIMAPDSLDRDAPRSNPHSSLFVQLSGRVADGYELKVLGHYLTSNYECTRSTTTFGGSTQIMVLQELPVTRDGEAYATKVQIDKYLPGRCQWFFHQVIYRLWPKDVAQTNDPYWQWNQWIRVGGPPRTTELTVKCLQPGERARPARTPEQCQPAGGVKSSTPSGTIQPGTRVVVNFE
jgi:hypothetical protein